MPDTLNCVGCCSDLQLCVKKFGTSFSLRNLFLLYCALTCAAGNQEMYKGNHKRHWFELLVKKFTSSTKAHVHMHCTICFLCKAHLGKGKLIVREGWLLSQCLVLHMGSHSSFLPAVVCTLEKALNSYNSDTDPTNPANPMPRCAPLPCERQIWTFTTNGTPRFREVACTFPQPQPKGDQQGHSQRITQRSCQAMKWAPRRPTEAGLVCVRTPKDTVGLCGSSRFTWEKLLISWHTVKSRASQRCCWSKYLLMHRPGLCFSPTSFSNSL